MAQSTEATFGQLAQKITRLRIDDWLYNIVNKQNIPHLVFLSEWIQISCYCRKHERICVISCLCSLLRTQATWLLIWWVNVYHCRYTRRSDKACGSCGARVAWHSTTAQPVNKLHKFVLGCTTCDTEGCMAHRRSDYEVVGSVRTHRQIPTVICLTIPQQQLMFEEK